MIIKKEVQHKKNRDQRIYIIIIFGFYSLICFTEWLVIKRGHRFKIKISGIYFINVASAAGNLLFIKL